MLAAAPQAQAQDLWTHAVSGDWSAGSNWFNQTTGSNNAPGGGDVAIISGGTAVISKSTTASTTCGELRLGDIAWPNYGNGTVLISGTTTTKGLSVGGDEILGVQSLQGFVYRSGAKNSYSGTLYLGQASDATGTYNLSAGTSGSLLYGAGSGGEYVGYNGIGSFNQTGGSNNLNFTSGTNGTLNVGWGFTSSGNYTLTNTSSSLNTYLMAGDEYIGNTGTGNFVQSGGSNSLQDLYLGYGYYSGTTIFGIGTYTLSATNGSGSMSAGSNEYVGYAGSGIFTQISGTNTLLAGGSLFIGCNQILTSGTGSINYSGTGLYSLSGGLVKTNSGDEYIGYSSTVNSIFNHTGGTNSVVGSLVIGNLTGSVGTYNLSTNDGASLLSVTKGITVGNAGTGTLTQTGGTVTLTGTGTAGTLVVGGAAGGNGTYNFSGDSTRLFAANEYITQSASATGLFSQTGGSNTTNVFSIGAGGYYSQSGGTLQVDVGGLGSGGSFSNLGTFDGTNSAGDLYANSIVDLTHGTWRNIGSTTFTGGTETLLIVGTNGVSGFGTVNNAGITHVLGTTLTVAAGQGFGGAGWFSDPVVCAGYITASPSTTVSINLSNGLILSGTGAINLGQGTLTVNDINSAISGGSLIAYNQFVASSGTNVGGSTGGFSQSGGTNTLTHALYVGYNAADSGSYGFGGTATISTPTEYVGYAGTGYFGQTSGTNSLSGTAGTVYVGNIVGSIGTYTLRTGFLNSNTLSVGNSGVGSFLQSGGLATLASTASSLTLGNNIGGLGNYTLTGGSVSAVNEWVGNRGVGNFVESAGTNSVASAIVIANSASSVGNYTLNNGSISSTAMQVANAGTGSFIQLGGFNNVSSLFTVGNQAGSLGTYTMRSGILSVAPISGNETIGNSGTGIFVQNGGTNNIGSANFLSLGANPGSFGMYTLGPNPGSLLNGAANEYIGSGGTGIFLQTGGSNDLASGNTTEGYLYINGNGTYSLSGSSQLSTTREYIGVDQNGNPSGTGQFIQTGGTNNGSTNSTYLLSIGPNSRFVLGGGTLTVVSATNNSAIGFFSNSGTFDGNNQTSTFITNTFIDLTAGTWLNTEDMNFIGGGNCLLILPKGTNPSSEFASVNNAGVTYTVGSPLVVNRKTLTGSINVQDQTQVSNGILQISSFAGSIINLNNGLVLTGSSTISLGNGNLTVNDTTSLQSNASSLNVNNQYIGLSGTQPYTQSAGSVGVFAQTGGTNNISQNLYLGYNPLDIGTYTLSTTSGTGLLSVGAAGEGSAYVGYSGTGIFLQTGGTNYVASGLYLGNNSGSFGTYTLNATNNSGLLQVGTMSVGKAGHGSFTQNNSTVTVNNDLNISGGTYTMTGGTMTAADLVLNGNSGPAYFNQSAGTVDITQYWDNHNNNIVYVGFGGPGTYNLSGTSSPLLTTLNMFVGINSGSGTFNQSSGVVTAASGSMYIGEGPSTTGIYNLTGGSLAVGGDPNSSWVVVGPNELSIGLLGGLGTFNQSGGSVYATGLTLGDTTNSVSRGTYNLTGGLLVVDYNGITGNPANSVLSLNGGTLKAGNSIESDIGFQVGVPISLGVNGGYVDTTGFEMFLGETIYGPGGLSHCQ